MFNTHRKILKRPMNKVYNNYFNKLHNDYNMLSTNQKIFMYLLFSSYLLTTYFSNSINYIYNYQVLTNNIYSIYPINKPIYRTTSINLNTAQLLLEPPLYKQKSVNNDLKFDSAGNFKILVISDLHYQNGKSSPCRDILNSQLPCDGTNTTYFIQNLLELEKPDLVISNGDSIDWGASDAKTSLNEVFTPIINAKIPYALVLGNHDQQSSLNRREVMEFITTMNYSISLFNPNDPEFEDINGYGNYHLIIGKDDASPEFILYFLDSGADTNNNVVKGYDWIHSSQIDYLKQTCNKYYGQSGLLFWHIPTKEYEDVKDYHYTGSILDSPGTPNINSGLVTNILECNNIKGGFVGHSHNNDFCFNYYGTHLCHIGGTGFNGYGIPGKSRKARIIHIKKHGKEIHTWKRMDQNNQFTKFDKEVF